MTVSDSVSPSPRGGGGAGSAPSQSATGNTLHLLVEARTAW